MSGRRGWLPARAFFQRKHPAPQNKSQPRLAGRSPKGAPIYRGLAHSLLPAIPSLRRRGLKSRQRTAFSGCHGAPYHANGVSNKSWQSFSDLFSVPFIQGSKTADPHKSLYISQIKADVCFPSHFRLFFRARITLMNSDEPYGLKRHLFFVYLFLEIECHSFILQEDSWGYACFRRW